ncbi:ABC transporter permease [Aerococcus urinaehominis]|uniref:ABC transporter permease n=1 Tax=Aerococcus urinaehominis TaxID=128944 RepID=A0A120IAW5_9LACT|nr:ABC transporter ATP-binding protein [Aerococcus urinaehominis]AMB99295.1 ABC transporter permease [Aerococcus urinaehominis]SDM19296.1 ATP-binding cassette, subfamily B [Aerococcus urinaehominis]
MYVKDYIKANWGKEVLAFTVKVVESILELLVPLVMADLINNGINANNPDYIWRRGLWLIILPVTGYCFALICQWLASVTMQTVGTNLRQALHQQMSRLDNAQLDKVGAESIVTQVTNDTNNIQEAVAKSLRLASRSPVITIGSMFMAFRLSLRLSPIFIGGGILLAIIFFWITLDSNRRFTGIQNKLDQLSSLVRENLNGVRVIRAFVNQDRETSRFTDENQDMRQQQVVVGRVQALATPGSLTVVNLCIGLILYFGARLVNNGFFMQGEVIALIQYMNNIFLALSILVKLIVTISRGVASAKRIDHFLSLKPTITSPDQAQAPNADPRGMAVNFVDVSFGYSQVEVLHQAHFTIKPGQFIGIIGGTGSAKTTLINLIPRFYDVNQGQVLANGQDVRDWPLNALRRAIALVPQKATLLKGTIRDNMKMAKPEASDQEIWQALDQAQAGDFVRAKADGLDSPVSQGGVNFSGGQRQRLTIARALLQDSQLIILDDSVSALDFATERRLREVLMDLDKTIIMVSQRISSIRYADQIIVLDHGQQKAVGHHDDLLAQSASYQEIYYSQYPDERPEVD